MKDDQRRILERRWGQESFDSFFRTLKRNLTGLWRISYGIKKIFFTDERR
jgi:hypothetical protein